ncbi:hypothetical protein Tco_1203088 [Tanacetum coccineum]
MSQESSSQRAREELKQEVAKKQKMEVDKEKEDLKQCFEIVQYDEVAIDAIPVATKPAPILKKIRFVLGALRAPARSDYGSHFNEELEFLEEGIRVFSGRIVWIKSVCKDVKTAC